MVQDVISKSPNLSNRSYSMESAGRRASRCQQHFLLTVKRLLTYLNILISYLIVTLDFSQLLKHVSSAQGQSTSHVSNGLRL